MLYHDDIYLQTNETYETCLYELLMYVLLLLLLECLLMSIEQIKP